MDFGKVKCHCEKFSFLHLGEMQKVYGVFVWETDECDAKTGEPTCQALCLGGYREDIAMPFLKRELDKVGLHLLVNGGYIYAAVSKNIKVSPPLIAMRDEEDRNRRNGVHPTLINKK